MYLLLSYLEMVRRLSLMPLQLFIEQGTELQKDHEVTSKALLVCGSAWGLALWLKASTRWGARVLSKMTRPV